MRFSNNIKTIFILCLFGCNLELYPQIPPGYETGINFIDSDDIKNSITFLASDSLKGRASGSAENIEAAKYIAKKFYEAGLMPYQQGKDYHSTDFDDDEGGRIIQDNKILNKFYEKYFQKFFITDSKINSSLTCLTVANKIDAAEREFIFKIGQDFFVSFKSQHGFSLQAPIVFAGYGIDKGENDYNDYAGPDGKEVDVKDKIVLIIDGFPKENDSSSSFSTSKNVLYKSVRKKAEAAMDKGALAVLVAQSPIKNEAPFLVKYENLIKSSSRSDFSLPELINRKSIPIIYVSKDVVKELFYGQSKTLPELLSGIESELKPHPIALTNSLIKIDLHYDVNLIPAQNVIGFLEGSDEILKKEFIVVGAHYDHVGLGFYGTMDKKNVGQIHNGADDNASGTSGLIELVEAFSKCKPKRSIIFAAFSGEENGILGSRYYASQNPFKEISQTAAMINLDMIGRNEPELVWVGGIFYSNDLKNVVTAANSQIGFELLYNVGLLNFASDQGPFIRKEIPSLFFFSGLHDEYHTPDDDVNKINFEKVERISKLAFLSTWILANQNEKPKFNEASTDEKFQLVKESLERQKKYRPDEKRLSN